MTSPKCERCGEVLMPRRENAPDPKSRSVERRLLVQGFYIHPSTNSPQCESEVKDGDN